MGYQENPYYDEPKESREPSDPPGDLLVCKDCHLAVQGGRFFWPASEVPASNEYQCPACARTALNHPGAQIELFGDFLKRHCKDILLLVSQTEEMERKSHPLQRVIRIDHSENRVVISTTFEHLSRKIAERICSACGGELQFPERAADEALRIVWTRK